MPGPLARSPVMPDLPMPNLSVLARCRILAAAAGIGLMVLSGCAIKLPPSLPGEYLGRWYYLGSSGGISGVVTADEGTGYVVIHSDNTIDDHEEDGTLIRTTTFTVDHGPTIFAAEDQWILNLDSGPPEVMMVAADGRTMTLSENVYDGLGIRTVF